MGDALPRWSGSDIVGGVVGIALAAAVTVALIGVLSGLNAEAAPAATESDLALFDSARGLWHLRYGDGSVESFYFGIPGDSPLLGDWDCDGIDSVALYRPTSGYVYLRNTNSFGVAESDFYYGIAADVPLAGDWDGDGCDTLGVQRDGQFFLADSLGTVPAGTQFYYGLPGDVPYVGDFDGDGRDTIGLHRTSAAYLYLSNVNLDGRIAESTQQFSFGMKTDRVVSGDWDGDGDDSIGVYRYGSNRFHLAFENGQSFSDLKVDFGRDDSIPVTGYFGSVSSPDSAVLVGAGDIGRCDNDIDEATASLLDGIAGTVFTAGDNVYPDGTERSVCRLFRPGLGSPPGPDSAIGRQS